MNYLCHNLHLSCAGCNHQATRTQQNTHAQVQGDGQNRCKDGRRADKSRDQCNRVRLSSWVLCRWMYPSCPFNSREIKRDDPGTCVGCRLWMCACDVLWWVMCRCLSHRPPAVKAPVRFPLPAWPRYEREGAAGAQLSPAIDGASRGAHYCRGRWCVFFAWGGCSCPKRRRGAPTAAGSAGGVASYCRGRWCVLTTRGMEPPILPYEPILLTIGPIQASCAV